MEYSQVIGLDSVEPHASCVGKIAVRYSHPPFSPAHSRFSIHSIHFMDVYHEGLGDQQAAWAGRKYHKYHLLLPRYQT